jgi:hypothetical protein
MTKLNKLVFRIYFSEKEELKIRKTSNYDKISKTE